MGNWDFLLQKTGDKQWGTAHKSDLKLKAGSYRIAAKGDPSVDVAVTVEFASETASEGEAPKTQTRAKRTNAKGLLAIVPFTEFKAGQWTISCQSLDQNNPWEKVLNIQVKGAIAKPKTFKPLPLPPNPNLFSFDGSLGTTEPEQTEPQVVESVDTEETVLDRSLAKLMATKNEDATAAESLKETVSDTLKDLEVQEATPTETELEDWSDTETAAGLLQGSLQELDELLKAELEPIWQEMDRTAQKQAAQSAQELSQPDFLAVTLEQPVLTWQGDRPVTIAGTLRATKDIPEQYQPALRQIKIRFQLVNPQNSQQQVAVEQQLNNPEFPHNFRQVIAIDPNWQTLTIVGDITVETNEQPPQILATQGLNLIADYQAIAANIHLPEVPPEDEALLNDGDIDLPEPESFVVAETVPDSNPNTTILPPKLSTQGRTTAAAPELPTFMKTSANADHSPIGEAVLEEAEITEIPTDSDSDSASEPETKALPGGDEPVVMGERSPTTEDSETPTSEAEDDIPYPFVLTPEETQENGEIQDNTDEEIPTVTEVETEEDASTGVPDLDWNSRFFQRLNVMATDTSGSAWLEDTAQNKSEAEDSVVIFQKDVMAMQPLTPDPEEGESLPNTMEIVVDSLWEEAEATAEPQATIEPSYDASGLPHPPEFLQDSDIPDNAIQASQPTPEPVLSLTKTEYRPEDMAVVQVTLPPHPDRLYVKLWLQDRQSRTLLAGPYQLTDFTPNDNGESETLTQVLIPQGAIEIRFEAIAINPRLQQESRKVGIDRRVIPQNFSEMNWDDLEV
ncbi:hypothetical protein Lepto7376_3850 [[Leptolyngbya] sp. PCC 7376]|nr:hypothetical protein Lepto7376_3850 [[Leptolyngbya] sp. PCC 7376]